jgi:hypothetical protein
MEKIYHKVYEAKNGEFYDSSHYSEIITETSMGFDDNGNVLFCFIKNAIPKEDRQTYKDTIRNNAKKRTKNRGSASGEVNIKRFPNGAFKFCKQNGEEYTDNKKRFSVFYKKEDGTIINRCQSNQVYSGVAGYFDKVNGNLPCRLVGFSRDNVESHKILSKLARTIENNHKTFVPESYDYHKSRALECAGYLFEDSMYSTMTLNYDFRTASHRDKGDLEGGLSTLTIFEDIPNNYEGFYTGLPEYKIAFDVRDGDTLIFNAHEVHCNTEYKVLSDKLPIDDFTDYNFAGRIAVVCYLRERLNLCSEES